MELKYQIGDTLYGVERWEERLYEKYWRECETCHGKVVKIDEQVVKCPHCNGTKGWENSRGANTAKQTADVISFVVERIVIDKDEKNNARVRYYSKVSKDFDPYRGGPYDGDYEKVFVDTLNYKDHHYFFKSEAEAQKLKDELHDKIVPYKER